MPGWCMRIVEHVQYYGVREPQINQQSQAPISSSNRLLADNQDKCHYGCSKPMPKVYNVHLCTSSANTTCFTAIFLHVLHKLKSALLTSVIITKIMLV